MPEFFDVVLHQRACRAFAPDDVPDELVSQVLTAALHAPSAENRQPWIFIVVRDPGARAELGAIMSALWERSRDHERAVLAPYVFADVDAGLRGGIAAAPVLVVVGGDTTRSERGALASSIFPAVQNLLLAAAAVGLGSALTTLAAARADAVRDVVGFPDHIAPMAVVPIGYPARALGPPRREPLATKAFRDRFGSPWNA